MRESTVNQKYGTNMAAAMQCFISRTGAMFWSQGVFYRLPSFANLHMGAWSVLNALSTGGVVIECASHDQSSIVLMAA
jgi:hypothetical protein